MVEPKDKLILIVEDDESVVEFLKFAIERDGFYINVAKDGLEALNLIKMSAPDLIVLDMMLPRKSGFEVIKSLQTAEYRHIPILVVTGKYTDDSFHNMVQFEPNVKDYTVKPIKINNLLYRIHSIFGTVSPEEKSAIKKGEALKEKYKTKEINDNF